MGLKVVLCSYNFFLLKCSYSKGIFIDAVGGRALLCSSTHLTWHLTTSNDLPILRKWAQLRGKVFLKIKSLKKKKKKGISGKNTPGVSWLSRTVSRIRVSMTAVSQDVQTRFPVELAFAKFLSKIKGNFWGSAVSMILALY